MKPWLLFIGSMAFVGLATASLPCAASPTLMESNVAKVSLMCIAGGDSVLNFAQLADKVCKTSLPLLKTYYREDTELLPVDDKRVWEPDRLTFSLFVNVQHATSGRTSIVLSYQLYRTGFQDKVFPPPAYVVEAQPDDADFDAHMEDALKRMLPGPLPPNSPQY